MIWPSVENRINELISDLYIRKKSIIEFIETVKETIPEEVIKGYREEYKQITTVINVLNKTRKELGG